MVWSSRARYGSESGKRSTRGLFLTETQGKQACVLEVIHKASNPVRIQFILEVGGMVNKPRLQVLIYPGKPFVCLGFGRNGTAAHVFSVLLIY